MARVTRVALFQREIRERLSEAALDVLLSAADVISEGQVAGQTADNKKYFGSTMLTLDLTTCKGFFRDIMDSSTANRVAELLRSDDRIQPRLRELALREAERVAGGSLQEIEMEIRVDTRSEQVLVDLDVEATVTGAKRDSAFPSAHP